ncbi:MAG: CvpA family protein [Clostridia bacterium]|nr:CvpA family protein [Clostridia bacterium]
MQILDYIIIAVALVSFVLGLVKGFLTPVVNLAGFFVVLYAGGAFSTLLFPLISQLIPDESTCSVASTIASMLLVWFIYFLISRLILKIIKKSKILGFANRLVGGVLGIVIVYLVVAIVTAFMQNDNTLFASVREQFGEVFNQSWVVQNVFKTNPIGEGLVNSAFQKLIELLENSLIPQA